MLSSAHSVAIDKVLTVTSDATLEKEDRYSGFYFLIFLVSPNRCLTLVDRVQSYSVDASMTRILPNITLIAISIFQESLGYYSVCDVVFAAKILSQKTHRWHISAYKHKVKSAGTA